MKYYLIAGEASGDLHASNLIKKIKERDPEAKIRGWGGNLMISEGMEMAKHIRELAFMGFTEVLLNIKTIKNNIRFCKEDIKQFGPDALILVDYPGFNLRIAESAHQKGIKVFYYISPQLWAWKKSRINKIRKFVDQMFVILPFEKDFYKENHYDVTYVGHPLSEAIDNFNALSAENKLLEEIDKNKRLITLMPGSRKQEIKRVLPLMVSVKNEFPDFEWVIAAAPSIDKDFYQEILQKEKIKILFDKTYPLLSQSYAALVTSGTATLETALFKIPQIVCYKGGFLSYKIGKMLVNKKVVKYISLVNLIMGKPVVKELIQKDLTKDNLSKELDRIINNQNYRNEINDNYNKLQKIIGKENTSKKVADLIIQNI